MIRARSTAKRNKPRILLFADAGDSRDRLPLMSKIFLVGAFLFLALNADDLYSALYPKCLLIPETIRAQMKRKLVNTC